MMKLGSAIQRVLVVWLSLTGLIFLTSAAFAAQEEKVIISYSSRDFAVLPAHIALTKGFFKEEGLDPVMVQMRPPVAGPALMNGEIHYTTTFGSMLNGIMQGMAAKLLAVMTEKPPYYIVARPGINSVMELRGKKLAAQPRGRFRGNVARNHYSPFGFEPYRARNRDLGPGRVLAEGSDAGFT